jgi:hypothetical protein
VWLVMLYLVLWVGLFIFILPGFSLDRPLGVEMRVIEKPIKPIVK